MLNSVTIIHDLKLFAIATKKRKKLTSKFTTTHFNTHMQIV